MIYTNNVVWKSNFYKLPKTSSFDILPTVRYVVALSEALDRYRGLCISWGRYGASLQFTILKPETQKFQHEEQVVSISGKDVVIPSGICYAITKMYDSLSESDKKEFAKIGGEITQLVVKDAQ
jgi:hypothetical protein